MKLKPLYALLLFLLTTGNLFAQRNAAIEADKQPVDREVYHGYLPNGLAYYVRKNSSPKKRAVILCTI